MKPQKAYFCVCEDLGWYNFVRSKSLSRIYEGCKYLCTLFRFTCRVSVDVLVGIARHGGLFRDVGMGLLIRNARDMVGNECMRINANASRYTDAPAPT